MKKLSIKQCVYISVFLMLILLSVLAVYPVYRKVSAEIKAHVEQLCLEFEERTGLVISYKSISPSFLTGFRVNSIALSNSSDPAKSKILEVDSIVLSYSIWDLITGDTGEAIAAVTVDGITLDFNKDTDITVVEKLSDFVKIFSGKEENGEEGKDLKTLDKIKSGAFNVNLPVDVVVKNVRLKYSQDGTQVTAFLRKINLDYQSLEKNLGIQSEGNIVLDLNENHYSCRFSSGGTLTEKLAGSSLIFRFSNFTDGDITVGRINLLFDYDGNVFQVSTVQNSYPLYILGKYYRAENRASVSVQAKNLTASSLITGSKDMELFDRIKAASVNLDSSISYNLNTKAFDYNAEGSLFVSEKAVPGGFDSSFSFSGNEKSVEVDYLKAFGDSFNAAFNGSLSFKSLGLSGTLSLNRLKLESGGVISTEMYFDPLESGFMGFAPQVFIGDNVFTALQIDAIPRDDSIDFDLEISDYSHVESEEPGVIRIDGSFMTEEKYVQAGVSVSRFYLDSVARTAVFFSDPENKSSFSFLENYLFNGELFASSDLKSFTFNVPFAYAANIKTDDEFLYLSVDGNNNSVQLSRCDYIKNGKKSSCVFQFDKNPDSDDYFVSANINVNSIPYNFTGTVMSGVVSISGDYGVSLELYKSGEKRYDGSLSMENLPVSAGDSVFSIAADTALSFTHNEGFDVQIANLSVVETTSRYTFNPRLSLRGSVSPEAVVFDDIEYSDSFSTLHGSSSCSWILNNGLFESLVLDFAMKNPEAVENLMLSAQITNPELVDINGENFRNAIYLNSQLVITSFNMNRFTLEQSENNSMTAQLSCTGTIEDPYIGINVSSVEMMMSGNLIRTSFSAAVEDRKASVNDFYLRYNDVEVHDGQAGFDLDEFSGSFKAGLEASFGQKSITAPVVLTVESLPQKEKSFIPKSFTANLQLKNVSGSLFRSEFPVEVTILKTNDDISFFTSDYIGIRGTLSGNGDIEIHGQPGKAVNFDAVGNAGGKELFVSVQNVDIDAGLLCKNIVLDAAGIFQGRLKGNILITGLRSDPFFQGSLSGSNIEFNLPYIVPEHITVPKAELLLEHNEITLPVVWGKIKNKYPISAFMKVYMDRWAFDHLEATISTGDDYGPADLDINVAQFTGMAKINLDLFLQDNYFDINGDVYVQKTNARTKTFEPHAKAGVKTTFKRTDLNIHLGQHVNFQFDPILHCLFVPDSVFRFKYDEEDSSFSVDGNVELRSGDVAWLNRNFYLKKGALKFNGNDPTFDPVITVRAETRERDEDGNEIKIILAADNQKLSSFNPQFSSVPAKSETEIRSILGQLDPASSGNTDDVTKLLLATSDYAVQSLVGRNVENKLRDFFNFDILSIRTMVLQNALKSSLSTDKSKTKDNDLTIGNLLDNSTVYIGKYLGSSLYVDALMHWSYDEARLEDKLTPGGLVFKPEFGLEIEAPFANIRWNMAPEITGAVDKKLVSSTSVTLSWKFSF